MASIGHLNYMSSATLSQPLYDMLRVSTSTLLSLSQSQDLYWHCHDLYNQYPGLYILQALSSLIACISQFDFYIVLSPPHNFYSRILQHSTLMTSTDIITTSTIFSRPLQELSWSLQALSAFLVYL